MFPGAIASRLHDFLDAVSTAASTSDDGGGKVMLRQTQKAVQSIVPALKEHGAEAGVSAHFVVQVCVLCRPVSCRAVPCVSLLSKSYLSPVV